MRVLLVDDSEIMRRIAIAALAGLGPVQVVEAADGRAALPLFADAPFDLVITDWNMPVMDGLDLTRAIRRTDVRTPIVMASTEHDPVRIQSARGAGIDEYVMKPYGPNVLRAVVRRVLDARRGPSRRAA